MQYYLTDDLDYHTYVTLSENDVVELGLKDLDLCADEDVFTQAEVQAIKTILKSNNIDFKSIKYPLCRKITNLEGDYLQTTKPVNMTERTY